MGTSIEWTDETWNPTRGCSLASPGCTNCYAMKFAHRFAGEGGTYEGLTKMTKRGPVWTGEVRTIADALDAPLHWRKPRQVFVNSMSDLFHETLSNEAIAAVFGVMAATPRHTFQVLTKRSKRMREWFEWISRQAWARDRWIEKVAEAERLCGEARGKRGASGSVVERVAVLDCAIDRLPGIHVPYYVTQRWPLPNVQLGVSVENQKYADERGPDLLGTPAAVRFLSIEPLLGHVDIRKFLRCSACGGSGTVYDEHDYCSEPLGCQDCRGGEARLSWVIVGAESGPGARPMNEDWVRSLRDQCVAAGVPFFYKQRLDERKRKVSLPMLDGRQWAEFPVVRS